MENALTEANLKRAAERERQEAEEQASIATLKRRIFETIPVLESGRLPFTRRAHGVEEADDDNAQVPESATGSAPEDQPESNEKRDS